MPSCRMCIWFSTFQIQEERAKVTRFKNDAKDGYQFSRKPIKELVTVDEYYCNKYKERINNISRAEKCKYYIEKGKLITLDNFANGNSDIRVELDQ